MNVNLEGKGQKAWAAKLFCNSQVQWIGLCKTVLCWLHFNMSHSGCLPLCQRSRKFRSEFKWNRVPKCDVTKNKFVKLCDLAPFSNRASLKRDPCQKLPLNCNSQPKYKGWKFDTAPYKSLYTNFESVPSWIQNILKGLYGMLSNFDPLYLHRELQFRANFWDEGIFYDPL